MKTLKQFIQWMFWGMLPWYLLWFTSKMTEGEDVDFATIVGAILIVICVTVSGFVLTVYFAAKDKI